MKDDYYVTVCDKCFQASCWHGVFMCDYADSAGTVEKKASDLMIESRESPSHYSIDNLIRICGSVNYINQRIL